ncbi:hypothetical protein [Rufibacter psychrotolerans]|uniref:hypothetical protein n=1 Tax=Rufibacter psychrotolerans TaxID=2812556 RepID=UPI001966FFEA|nr:hypothetical protein [Rufibacter sp. SYSU D00308]
MPSSYRRLVWLRVLVVVSIIGSLCSSFTLIKGWGELYPFANWKLFTQPRGSDNHYSTYRIYTRTAGEKTFQRQAVRPTRTFDQDDYVYTLDYWVNRTLADSAGTTNSKARLHTLIKYLHPEASEYRIVRESTTVEELLHHPNNYEADTVVWF